LILVLYVVSVLFILQIYARADSLRGRDIIHNEFISERKVNTNQHKVCQEFILILNVSIFDMA